MSRSGLIAQSVLVVLIASSPAFVAFAQSPPPVAVESRPLPPPADAPPAPAPTAAPAPAPAPAPSAGPASTAPEAPAAAAPAPAAPAPVQQAQPVAPPSKFLAPPPADPSIPDEVVLVSKPAIILKGQSSWDDGYERLMGAFRKLDAEAKKAGLVVSGRPVTLFVDTDDQGFRYEALLPVETLPAQRPAGMPADIRLGGTPEGKAIRFVHQAAYDDIDSTYEAITAYLDLKGIEVKDTLIEEYVEFGKDAADGAIEINIYVQPRK